MPFDDTTVRFQDAGIIPHATHTSLAAMGLAPVPFRTIRRHRAQVIADFMARGILARHRVAVGHAKWRSVWVVLWHDTLRLTGGDILIGSRHRNTFTPPQALADLANTVYRAISNVHFVMEYFDEDPILYACYADGAGVPRCDCLGIWEGGDLIAIAEPLTEAAGFWAKLVRCVCR